MSIGKLNSLGEIFQGTGNQRERDSKLVLSRLVRELRQRREKGSTLSIDYFEASLRSLCQIRGPAHADIRMECLNQCAQFFYANGDSKWALRSATELRRLSLLAEDKDWLRVAENLSGVLKADLGNVPDAVAHHYKAIELAKELDNPFAEISYLINLGVTLNYAGLYREAIPCFRLAEHLSRRSRATTVLVATAAANLAQSHLALDEFQDGFSAITRALAESLSPSDAPSALARTIREFTFVQLALELGQFTEARHHAELCRSFADQSGAVRGSFLADATSALCEIYYGAVDRGLMTLEELVQKTAHNSSFRIDALTFLVKAYDQAGRSTESLKCLRELLSYMRGARERSVVALLSTPATCLSNEIIQPEQSDLGALQFKEASLRAKVAERDLFDFQIDTLERLAITADLKEDASGQHGYRVGRLVSLFCATLGWNREACFLLEMAARLHDIGKIAIPDRILFASEELKAAQRELMFAHTSIGAQLLSKSNQAQLRLAEEIASQHHEWWNGLGYPSKLSGKRISVSARVVALADVFDALTHGRPYAPPWDVERALQEIRSKRGTQFDPELTDSFLDFVAKLQAQNSDIDAHLTTPNEESSFVRARKNIKRMLHNHADLAAP